VEAAGTQHISVSLTNVISSSFLATFPSGKKAIALFLLAALIVKKGTKKATREQSRQKRENIFTLSCVVCYYVVLFSLTPFASNSVISLLQSRFQVDNEHELFAHLRFNEKNNYAFSAPLSRLKSVSGSRKGQFGVRVVSQAH
jgi:hypothetical protein